MTIVIADASVIAQLGGAQEPLELRAQDGRLLGHFIPLVGGSPDPRLTPQISEDELRRRERAGGGRPLVNILADLEKRA
jgi:hypothetical protein